jgi:hypothetical protein
MKLAMILVVTLALLAGADTYSLMYFKPVDQLEALRFQAIGPDIVHVYEDGGVDFVANDYERRMLDEQGFVTVTRMDDLESFYRKRCSGREMGGFMTWDEIQTWLDDLHAAYPDITSPATSIGNTIEARPQLVMKISENNVFDDDDPLLPNAWYDGLIHAREPASMRNVRSFMEWLCENYGAPGYCGLQATWLLQNREIWCLPCNNPDGYVYNEQTSPGGGGMWRKNRRDNGGGVYGVDLNRNWSVAWGGPGSSSSPSSETYRGTAPLSEPEASNIDDFWQDHPPAQMHSTHTYGNILIYPWGWTDDPTTDAAEYDTSGEIMVQWATGELHGPSAQINYYSSGNTRDHSYALYDAMSWNHETGADFAGFWPGATEVVKLTRRNLRSFLVTALLAGCPKDPHQPEIPVMDEIGEVGSNFTVTWSEVPTADCYALEELEGYQVLLDDSGESGPFTLDNWSMTSSQYHSPSMSYVSDGTGSMTWTETAAIPAGGGGRLSFWAYYDIINGSQQGAFEVSPDGGSNWYYLQTFTRDDWNWRRNIHELDEWAGETLSFRWTSYGSSCDLYIDDIKVETWDSNTYVDKDIPTNSYSFSGHADGEYWFRAVGIDPDFGPSWPSEAEYALVTVGIGDAAAAVPGSGRTILGHVSPNPVRGWASIPVVVAPREAEAARVSVYDLAGRRVADLGTPCAGASTLHWSCTMEDGAPAPDGLYFCRLESPSKSSVRSFVLVR